MCKPSKPFANISIRFAQCLLEACLPVRDQNVPPVIHRKHQFSPCKQNVQKMRDESVEAICIKATGNVATHRKQLTNI